MAKRAFWFGYALCQRFWAQFEVKPATGSPRMERRLADLMLQK